LVPVRYLATALGSKVQWEETSRAVKITQSNGNTEKTVRVLFIGNGMTSIYSMPYIFEGIAKSKGKKVYVDGESVGSTVLSDAWNSRGWRNSIEKRKWDFVSVQDAMYYPQTYYFRNLRLFNNIITKSRAKMLIYNLYNTTNPDDGILQTYQRRYNKDNDYIAKELNALVAPIAQGYTNSSKKDMRINLYQGQQDGHPSEYGAYLNACLYYAVIFNESPEGAPAKFKTGSLHDMVFDISDEPEVVKSLQRTAWETYLEYKASHPVQD
jgi:hypothetical protein